MSIFVISLLLFTTSYLHVSAQNQTVYTVLERYGFPKGILPKGAVDYDFNRKNGLFKVYFNSTCTFPIDSFKLRYQPTISGVIRDGRIVRLRGVSVKVIFFWVNIDGVFRDGHDLEFSVGSASEEFSVTGFVESPECGCGFYCNNGLVASS